MKNITSPAPHGDQTPRIIADYLDDGWAFLAPAAGFKANLSFASVEVFPAGDGTLLIGVRHLETSGPSAAPIVTTPTDRSATSDTSQGRASARDGASGRRGRSKLDPDLLAADAVALQAANVLLEGQLTKPGYLRECSAQSWPAVQDLCDRHGSWNDAVRAAGLKPRGRGRPSITQRDCLNALAAVEELLGHSPTQAEYDRLWPTVKGPRLETVLKVLSVWPAA